MNYNFGLISVSPNSGNVASLTTLANENPRYLGTLLTNFAVPRIFRYPAGGRSFLALQTSLSCCRDAATDNTTKASLEISTLMWLNLNVSVQGYVEIWSVVFMIAGARCPYGGNGEYM